MARYIDMGTKGKAAVWRREFEAREQAAWDQFKSDPSNREFAAIWRDANNQLDKHQRVMMK